MWQGSPVTREIDVIRNTKCGCKETHPRVLPVNEQQRASVLFVRGIGVTTSGSPTQRGGGDSSCPSGRRSRVVCLRSTQFASQVPSPRGLTFAPDALFAESIHSLANEHFVIPAWLASPDLTTPFSPRWFSSLDSCDASIVTVLLLFSFITAFRSCLVARPAPFLASRETSCSVLGAFTRPFSPFRGLIHLAGSSALPWSLEQLLPPLGSSPNCLPSTF